MTIRISVAAIFVLCFLPFTKVPVRQTDQAAEPNKFFREYVGLSDEQIKQILPTSIRQRNGTF